MTEFEEWGSVKSMLDQISTSGISFPVFIDYGGSSYYSCGNFTNRNVENKKEEKDDELDILFKKVISYDNFRRNKLFILWKKRFVYQKLTKLQFSFDRWKIMLNVSLMNKKHINSFASTILESWRMYALERKATNNTRLSIIASHFSVWKKQHFMKQLTSRILKASSYIKKAKFFRKWRSRYQTHRLTESRKVYFEIYGKKRMEKCFSIWIEEYLFNIRSLSTDVHIKERTFTQWTIAYGVSRSLEHRYYAVSIDTRRNMLVQNFALWKRRVKLIQKKKHRRNIQLWQKTTKLLLQYIQVRKVSSIILEKKAFCCMRASIDKSNMQTKEYIMAAWKHYIITKKKFRIARNLLQSTCKFRFFALWKANWSESDDTRIVDTIQQCIVNPSLKKRCFILWISKALFIYKQKQTKATKFREIQLKKSVFKVWLKVSENNHILAEKHYNTNLLKGAFMLFHQNTIITNKINVEKATQFRSECIVKRAFSKFRIASAPVLQESDQIDQMIAMLNKNPSYSNNSRGPFF